MNRRAQMAIVLVATAVFLAAVLWKIDLAQARAALARMRWWVLAPMAGLYLAAHALRALRLGLLLDAGIPYQRLFSINTVGFLAINVIPLRLGEMVRPYLLFEREGVPLGRALAAIFVERLLDMLMLLGMLAGLTWLVDLPDGGLIVQGVDIIAKAQIGAAIIVAAGTLGGVGLLVAGEPALALLERLPRGAAVAGLARRFREGLGALAARPLRGLALLALSAAIWGLTIAAVGTVMAGFPGIPTGVGPAWTTWTITLTGMAAFPTPGFFGIYELCCAAALWLWGVDPDLARTFAVVLHLGQLGFTLLLGGIFLGVEGLSLRALVAPPPPAG